MKSKLTPVRLSHLCGSQGPGSIVKNVEGLSVVIKDIRYWASTSQIEKLEALYNVRRVKECLSIYADLKMPPVAQEDEHGEIKGVTIPSIVFPNYAVCNKCNKLHLNPWNASNNFSGKVYCQNQNCHSKYPLIQGGWCNISEYDQLSEVDWSSICHSDAKDPRQKKCKSTNLQLKKSKIKCSVCKSESNYINRKNTKMITDQPWLNTLMEDTNTYKEAEDNKKPQPMIKRQLVEVNNPQVYMPVLVDGLVIPPESNNQNHENLIEELSQKSLLVKELASKKLPSLVRDMNIRKAAAEFNCSIEDIKNAVESLNKPAITEEESLGIEGNMLVEEYQALITPAHFPKGADFITTHLTRYFKSLEVTDSLSPFKKMINTIVSVDRLRKINILQGITRLEVSNNDDGEEGQIKSITSPDIVGQSTWLPAVELFGEGLFFTIEEGVLETWESLPSVTERAEEIKDRLDNSDHFIDQSPVDARFILLHTLAHLIIRELELICGYPASSLEERIYSSREKGMQGVLIYTAVADINGSLGGLMEQAEPKRFLALLDGAFKHADWCSLDPICSEHKAQGPSGLNKAACHACSLLPETSCKYGNTLLDRVFIRGNKDGIPSFKQYLQELKND
jgi:hypothetical protein